MHILCDLDGVLADWGSGWDKILDSEYSHLVNIPRTIDQRDFNLKLNLNEEEQKVVDLIFDTPGFYENLDPIEGAIEGYTKMVEAGHHVQIATSPWWSNTSCLQDKSDWVMKHLGEDARKRMILTSDKTTIHADYLIDDKPSISGYYESERTWTQIVFSQPYNLEVKALHRMNGWEEIEEVMERAELHLFDFSQLL